MKKHAQHDPTAAAAAGPVVAGREVSVRPHSQHAESPDQYEVLLGKTRVAYVCVGEEMPINWLNGHNRVGEKLTVEEQIQVAAAVREMMQAEAEARAKAAAELARLTG